MRDSNGWRIAVAIVGVTRLAAASPREAVLLDDGRRLEGTLVEFVENDHVTLELDGGVRRRIDWSHIRSVDDLPSGSLAPMTDQTVRLRALLAPGARDTTVLVDWPEPDRSVPNISELRFSIGVEGTTDGPLGMMALEAEVARQWGVFQLGLHAGYGPRGPIGPAISEGLSLDWSYCSWLQQGLGAGLAHGFRSTAMDGTPSRVDYLDLDIGHVNIFVNRQIQLRATLGMSGGINGCPMSADCGVGVYGMGTVLWNFAGDH